MANLTKIVNGEVVELDKDESKALIDKWDAKEAEKALKKSETEYLLKRRAEYPSIEEQLEMIYADKVNGTETWITTISAINAKYPEPS